MKVLVSGASGLVGRGLVRGLEADGHEVSRLVRRAPKGPAEIEWDPGAGSLDPDALGGFDVVVHLAGENIAGGRWSDERKARIRDSRVDGTRLLVERLLAAEPRPRAFVGASAIGYYGDRGDTVCDESTPPGDGFLPDVCVAWEEAARPLADASVRVAHLRIGIVLSEKGGALKAMLLPFRLGVAGRLGPGTQWMSWIGYDDLIAALRFVIERDDASGAYNAVAPHPVTNAEYTKTLGRVLGRPTILPAPAFLIRLALGEMADALLLASTRVVPERLTAAGFAFERPALEAALRAELG
ncbi:MAG: TIGR01777 family oxidoreductase [Planctomycetota bacterium JB042]